MFNRLTLPVVILASIVATGCAHAPLPIPVSAARSTTGIVAEAAEYVPAPAAVDKAIRKKLEVNHCGGDYPYSVLLGEEILVRRSAAASKPNRYLFKCEYKEFYGDAAIVKYSARGTVDMNTGKVEITALNDPDESGLPGRPPHRPGSPVDASCSRSS